MARDKESPPPLTPREELLLKVAKEIVVKFIEVGRISPASFADTFTMVIDTCANSRRGKRVTGAGEKEQNHFPSLHIFCLRPLEKREGFQEPVCGKLG
jgi:hypothetical protein